MLAGIIRLAVPVLHAVVPTLESLREEADPCLATARLIPSLAAWSRLLGFESLVDRLSAMFFYCALLLPPSYYDFPVLLFDDYETENCLMMGNTVLVLLSTLPVVWGWLFFCFSERRLFYLLSFPEIGELAELSFRCSVNYY